MPNSQNYNQLRPQTLQTHVHKHQQTHVPTQQSSLINPPINTYRVQGVAAHNPTSLHYDHRSQINSYQQMQGQLYPPMPLTNTVPTPYFTGSQYPPGNGFRDASANYYRYADFGDDSHTEQYYEGEHYAPPFEQHSQLNGHGRDRGFNPPVGTLVCDQHERPMDHLYEHPDTRMLLVIRMVMIVTHTRFERQPHRHGRGTDIEALTRVLTEQAHDLHLKVQEFDDKSDADAFIDWLDKIEKIFTYKRYGDPKQVAIVEYRLFGYALTWWNSVQQSRMSQGYLMIIEWSMMRRDMKERFIAMNYEIVQLAKQANEFQITQSSPPIPTQTITFPAISPLTALRTYVLGNCYGYEKRGHQKRDCPAFANKVGLVVDDMHESVITNVH
ncbi:hypothetical protein GIB67_006641 [Kingdonia uniflora]|uniref:Gag protein n=1 Tax=Kingdonia uniflora TaxID=39325 RepID=A0A7J7L1A6_9MAGN|nr:hypothetical protein GIB67_006641 [Kingdonia uniflora]